MYGIFSCYYVCMHCTFGCHVPLSFQQQSVTNTVKSVENLASAKNARKSIQSKTANVNVSPTFYMVVRFKLECYWYTLNALPGVDLLIKSNICITISHFNSSTDIMVPTRLQLLSSVLGHVWLMNLVRIIAIKISLC